MLLSPSDPHIVLGAGSTTMLAVVAFVSRSTRSWAVYRGYGDLSSRLRWARLRAALSPPGTTRARTRSAVGAVLFLPSMVGAAAAARARMPARRYLPVMVAANLAGLVWVLAIAAVAANQVEWLRQVIVGHPIPSTAAAVALVALPRLARACARRPRSGEAAG